MAGKFTLSKYAETLEKPALDDRDVPTLKADFLRDLKAGGAAYLRMGKTLIALKAKLPHGEWLSWLEEVNLNERGAQRMMKLAREFSNPTALSDLGATKAMTLLLLPPEEREAFVAETHLVDGEEKTVIDMTSRELEKAIRERDEARKAAETAQADAKTAEEARAKMETDMQALKEMHQSALNEAEQAAEDLLTAQKELAELRARPVDVAVEVDQKAVEQARKDAIAEMQAKVDQAEAARKEAEKKRKDAEKALKESSAILSRAEKAEAELAEARRQLEAAAKAENASVVNQNGDLAMFNVIFSQTQEGANKLHGLRLKLGKNDEALDAKLKTAINALADAVRRCAE